MNKLSPDAESYLNKILKHYPMPQQPGKQNLEPQPKHQYPQQHLHDYRKERQIFDKPIKDKLENMNLYKQEGNNHYKNMRYQEASVFYQRAIIYSDYTFPENEDDCKVMDQLLQQVNCNMALCLIKMDQWEQSRVNLLEASKGKNLKIKAKALYWLTKFYIKDNQNDKAQKTMEKIRQMESPHNDCLDQLTTLMKSTIQSTSQKEKQVFGKMFQK